MGQTEHLGQESIMEHNIQSLTAMLREVQGYLRSQHNAHNTREGTLHQKFSPLLPHQQKEGLPCNQEGQMDCEGEMETPRPLKGACKMDWTILNKKRKIQVKQESPHADIFLVKLDRKFMKNSVSENICKKMTTN